MGRLLGKRAIVTGAAQGIGAATARAFAEEGAEVLALDKDASALVDLKNPMSFETMTIDLTDSDKIASLAADCGNVDILFNCVGIAPRGTILDCTDEDWDTCFTVNVRAMFQLTRALLPTMIAGGGGSIINVSSIASDIFGVADRFAYGASKAAVNGMTKAIAKDFVSSGIRCNAICPGTVETETLRLAIDQSDDPAAARHLFEQRQPMGRMAQPAEIAALAVYLASDESAFTTGESHVIGGGWSSID